MKSWKRIAALVAVGAALVFAATSAAGSGLGNGDFEHGNFDNWNQVSDGPGAWFIYSGNHTPNAGDPFYKPPQGTYAAVAEQEFESATSLYRMLPLGTSKTQQVSFYVYYTNYASAGFVPGEQEYRIDIMQNGADPLSTDPGDILKTLFRTKPGDPQSMKPTLKTYKLKGLSGNVTLRFLVIAIDSELHGAVDAVKLQSAS